MDSKLENRIMDAVEAGFDNQIQFLSEVVSHASTRGQEQSVQDVMAKAYEARGYEVDRWEIKVDDIKDMPGYSPVIGAYEEAVNVVGTHKAKAAKGRSLILNGHIDVVPAGPLDMWSAPPFTPHVEGDWLFGRGAGDMKAGLVANLFALDALRSAGFAPASDVFIQSVIEEESTGNGALSCLQRGYKADAVLIPEPFGEALVTAQLGVIWFKISIKGLPAHVAYAGQGANAIEAVLPIINTLHKLEERWNEPDFRHKDFLPHKHPLNLNIGQIKGGDWPSSVPSWCELDVRIGLYPGQDIAAAKTEIEAAIDEASKENSFLSENKPSVTYHGFLADGYALSEDNSERAASAIATLEAAHELVNGKALDKAAITCTTDTRFYGLYADIPALVYGPKAEDIHAFNERVSLSSIARVTKGIALFIANWCGLEEA